MPYMYIITLSGHLHTKGEEIIIIMSIIPNLYNHDCMYLVQLPGSYCPSNMISCADSRNPIVRCDCNNV